MEDKLTREEVLHVAELARIKISEEEIEKYQIDLKKLLKDVEKINEVEGYDDDIMIASWSENTALRKDEKGETTYVGWWNIYGKIIKNTRK